MLAFRHPLQLTNILRLVVKKSPTGESTHYFFFFVKVVVSCKVVRAPMALDVA